MPNRRIEMVSVYNFQAIDRCDVLVDRTPRSGHVGVRCYLGQPQSVATALREAVDRLPTDSVAVQDYDSGWSAVLTRCVRARLGVEED